MAFACCLLYRCGCRFNVIMLFTPFCIWYGSEFCFAQEFMSGSSLDRRIWNQPLSSVTWEEKLQWCMDTAKVWLAQQIRGTDLPLQGMAFVHSLGFAHRDLKSQNVLYDRDTGHAKVVVKCMACA